MQKLWLCSSLLFINLVTLPGQQTASTVQDQAAGSDEQAEPKTNPQMPGMDHSKMPGMDHSKMAGMDHSQMPGMQHATDINEAGMLLMDQASGTSMNPKSWPMPMVMTKLGSWYSMFMANAFIVDMQQSGPRGYDKFHSPNW